MVDINVNKLSEALNTKADIDLNNTGVFTTAGGGGVNLTSSTPADASGKEVVSADYIPNKFVTTDTAQTITGAKTLALTPAKKSPTADISITPETYMANEAMRVFDKNNNCMGIYHTNIVPASAGVFGNTGEVRCAMEVLNKDGYQAGIRVNVPVEGDSGAYAACPIYDENKSPSNAIVTKSKIANMATTTWVNSRLSTQPKNTMVLNRMGNLWLATGYFGATTSVTGTYTFPIPLPNPPMSFFLDMGEASDSYPRITSITTTKISYGWRVFSQLGANIDCNIRFLFMGVQS